MIGISAALIVGGTALLWLSHRVYLTYTHVVAREERSRRLRHEGPVRPRQHIGPRCFLALDFIVIFALIRVLESLAFDTANMSELRCLFLALTHFSGIVAFWMLVESRHLAIFYHRIAQALGGAHGRPQGDNLLDQRIFFSPGLTASLALVAFLPLVLELLGLRMGEASRENLLFLFGVCFVLPQLGLLALLGRRMMPLRRSAGLG